MLRLKSRKIENVSETRAKEFLKINNLKTQRHLRQRHVKNLGRKLQSGLAITPRIAYAVKLYSKSKNGKQNTVLVDGQHISHAIIRSKKPTECLIERYDVKTKEELSELYRQFNNEKTRNLGDCLKVETEALGIEWVDSKVATLLVGACASIIDPGREKLVKDDKIKLLKENREIGDFLNRLFYTGNPDQESIHGSIKHMVRVPVVMSIVKSYRINQKDCYKFWRDVRDGVGMDRKSPALKLRDYLKTITLHMGYGAVKAHRFGVKTVTAREVHAKCNIAWNAFRNGETTRLIYYEKSEIPEVI